MSKPVRIGKSYGDTLFVLSALAAGTIAAIGGVFAWAADSVEVAAGTAALAVPLAAVAAARAVVIARGRRWLTPTNAGFVLRDRRGEFEFADDDVTDLGTWAKTKFKNGVPKATSRKCHLTLHAGEAAAGLAFEYEYPLTAADPLGPFLDRNLDRLTAQAVADREAGRSLEGDGWLLDRAGLTHGAGPDEVTVPVAKVAAVDVVDGKVCVWAEGDAEPSVRVPAGSPNALILARVLGRELDARPARPDDGPGLGRVIFQRDHSIGPAKLAGFALLALVATAAGLGLGLAAWNAGFPVKMSIIAGFLVLFPVPAWVGAFLNRVNVFRCHTRGVCKVSPRGAAELRYDDVAGFTYSSVRHYHNGAYTGTQVALTFDPRSGDDKDRVAYSASIKNADDELDNLRDHVGRVVAADLLARWKAGEPVGWADGARFTADGLDLPPGGLLGRGDRRLVPLAEVAGHEFKDGTFHLFQHGQKKSVFSAKTSAANFFPGYFLLLHLLAPPAAPDPAAE